MPEIIIKGKAKDPNAELEKMGVPQDLPFGGQNTLRKRDVITRRDLTNDLKYFKFELGNQIKVGWILAGQPLDTGLPNFEWLPKHKAWQLMIGLGTYKALVNKYRTLKRFEKMQTLELIRNSQEIEKKMLKRN